MDEHVFYNSNLFDVLWMGEGVDNGGHESAFLHFGTTHARGF